MARFDVYSGRGAIGPLLDCQANILLDIDTRFVVPLRLRSQAPAPTRRLNPIFQIGDEAYVMMTQQAAAIPVRDLGRVVTSLIEHDSAIAGALDMLLFGF